MRPINVILVIGSLLTGIGAGALMAMTQDRRFFLPIILAGCAGIVCTTFWRWRTRPWRDAVALGFQQWSPLAYVAAGLVSLPFQAILAYVLVGAYLQSTTHPCLCPGTVRGGDWLNLVMWAVVGTFLESFWLLLDGFALLRLFGRRINR